MVQRSRPEIMLGVKWFNPHSAITVGLKYIWRVHVTIQKKEERLVECTRNTAEY